MTEPEVDYLVDYEPRVVREPEWMPANEKVAQARTRLERNGAIDALLRRSEATADFVPDGTTPWVWWAVAALWVLIWPAVLALKLTTWWLTFLPWPAIVAGILLHALVLVGPVLYSQRLASRSDLRRRFGKIRTLPEMLALRPNEFEAWIAMLFQLIGYQVRNTQYIADHGIDLVVSNEKTRLGLVQCKRYRGTVGEPAVRDLYGTLVHENADQGWLVTTGGVSKQAREWANGKPIEMWDGRTLVDLARRYR